LAIEFSGRKVDKGVVRHGEDDVGFPRGFSKGHRALGLELEGPGLFLSFAILERHIIETIDLAPA
jgi:hypothetical protein